MSTFFFFFELEYNLKIGVDVAELIYIVKWPINNNPTRCIIPDIQIKLVEKWQTIVWSTD